MRKVLRKITVYYFESDFGQLVSTAEFKFKTPVKLKSNDFLGQRQVVLDYVKRFKLYPEHSEGETKAFVKFNNSGFLL